MEKETDAGLVVSGAKVVATGSAITNYNFIAHYGLPIKKKEFALICTVPMDSPGIKLICRSSYTQQAAVMGSPFDYPLSSRMDENDTIFVFDKVLVPAGERLHVRRRRTYQRVLPAVGFPAALHLPGAAPVSRGEARLHRRPADEGPRLHRLRAGSAACRPASAR